MSNELVRQQLETGLQLGSLEALVKASVDQVMLLIDTSGSMDSMLRNGKRAIDALREVVADIRRQGDVATIAFGGPYDAQVRFVDNVPEPDGGTPLHLAIPFAKQYGATRLVVISDGCPDLREQSMIEAKTFGGKIDVVFVGDAGSGGSFFLDELARVTGGERFQGDLAEVKELTGKVVALLEGEVEEKRAPIQGEGFTAEAGEPPVEPEPEDEFDEDEDEDDDEEDDDDVE